MKISDVKQCSFSNWYNDFKKISIRSITLPLPDGFVQYILKDGIVLPKSKEMTYTHAAIDSDTSEDEENWDVSEEVEPEAPHFPEFDSNIEKAIETLGGKVFPKLNWSSPKDASWIAFNNSCCCSSVADIYLLLKSSDFIIHDLTKPFTLCDDFIEADSSVNGLNCESFYLVLRKWTEIDVSGEYRCFVKDNELIGISQREHSLYFDHINSHKKEIIEDIMSFFHKNIHHKFALSNYVFDVYRRKKGKVSLIDFNPFGSVTESLLFRWDELTSGNVIVDENGLPEFRYVIDDCGVQPRTLCYHALPRDIVDISTGEDSFKLMDLIKLKLEEQNEVSSEDESENSKIQ